MGFTPKEQDRVVHMVKLFQWEGNYLLRVQKNGWVWVVPCVEQSEGLIWHAHEKLGHFGLRWTYSLF